MTVFIATTTVDIYRGDTESAMGPVPSTTPINVKPIPFAITERTRRVYLPETSELRTVRYSIGRCVGSLDLRQHDRIKDQRTGKWWVVTELQGGERTAIGQSPLVCDLRRV